MLLNPKHIPKITKDMRCKLKELGYDQDDIAELTPAAAVDIIKDNKRPSERKEELKAEAKINKIKNRPQITEIQRPAQTIILAGPSTETSEITRAESTTRINDINREEYNKLFICLVAHHFNAPQLKKAAATGETLPQQHVGGRGGGDQL